MNDTMEKKHAERLQRARRFLEAGRTQIDPGLAIDGQTAAPIDGGLNDDAATKENNAAGEPKDDKPDPTRFGDWEKNGRCIDF